MRTLLQIVATALAVAVAAWLIPGIVVEGNTFAGQAITLLIVAVIIGVLNAVVRPVLKILTGCLIALTLGLFLLVVNAWILMLASWVSGLAGLGFHVNGFWSALFGSIIISLVTMLLSGITDKRKASA
ncbi:phage holin family protein [Granulicoccus sp. GXG6511]|uniref:phage holin family protein n=1 Tax=Granulicoccus sp. GXG6511 TaxID=3381351 RepID=UPI003D7C3BBA